MIIIKQEVAQLTIAWATQVLLHMRDRVRTIIVRGFFTVNGQWSAVGRHQRKLLIIAPLRRLHPPEEPSQVLQ